MIDFLASLQDYEARCSTHPSPYAKEQWLLCEKFRTLWQRGKRALDRHDWEGHLTGSGLVTDESMGQVLLTLHAKLGLWLQLGGHADFDPDLARVALRECQEESGINDLHFVNEDPSIFDLDIHWIPERKNEPGHWHYDVRFLLWAKRETPLVVSSESNDLKWLAVREAYSLTREISMHRQFDKLGEMRNSAFSR